MAASTLDPTHDRAERLVAPPPVRGLPPRRRPRARGRGWRELALFAAAYVTYFGVRAMTEGRADAAVDHAHDLLRLERALDIAWEEVAQDAVIASKTLVDIVNAVYIWGHWPVLIAGGVLLYHLHRPSYVRLRNVCLLSGALGLVVFALFPVAPPRLAGIGVIDTVTERAGAYRTVQPPSLVNEYAALPSYHAGWNLLLGIMLFRATRHLPVRAFAVLMPLGMAFAVIASANHFVIDVIAGGGLVLASLWIVQRVERRRGPPLQPDRRSETDS